MFIAVHSDRSGRVIVAHDRAAAAFDGAVDRVIDHAIPLPADSELVPLPREAVALDRSGRSRPLGPGRPAIAALLPPGHLRTLHPAYADQDHPDAELEPRAYAAVCADTDGALHVTALRTAASLARPVASGDASAGRGSNRVVRQLTRCARENRCADAAATLGSGGSAAIPVAAAPDAGVPRRVTIRARCEASVRERAALRPSAAEIADVALAHLAAGGERVSFGRSCEGDPLTALRVIDEAIRRIREVRPAARVHLETAAGSPPALRRLIDAGVRELTIHLASARADTYERLHGTRSHRYADVRTSALLAHDLGVRLTLAVLVLPGVTDRPREIDALAALAGELGAAVELRDLPADPRRAVALVVGRERPAGVEVLVARLREAA